MNEWIQSCTIFNDSAYDILHKIKTSPFLKDYTFIITGKVGPTGKTWLKNQLKESGYNAIEITDQIYTLVDYTFPDRNAVHFDRINRTSVIVLNISL